MDICHSGHEKIVYMNTYCPLCELKIEKDELESELKDTMEEIETLKAEIKELENKIEDYEHRHHEPNINEDDPRKER